MIKTVLKWEAPLENPIYGGLYPVRDPFEQSCFYIGDGWGSSYPSMKLRKLSLDNGMEKAAFPVKNAVRCIYINNRRLFAATDNKIWILQREDLTLEKKIEKTSLKYPDYLAADDGNNLLMMNHRGSYLAIMDYRENLTRKKKIAQSCRGIIRQNPEVYLVMDGFGGEIIPYHLADDKRDVIIEDKPFSQAKIGHGDKVFLRGGTITDNQGVPVVTPNREFRIVDVRSGNRIDEFDIPLDYEHFYLSGDQNDLYLIKGDDLHIFPLKEKRITASQSTGGDTEIIGFFPGDDLLFTRVYNENILGCYRLEPGR